MQPHTDVKGHAGEHLAAMLAMADGFDSAIGKIIQTVSTASSCAGVVDTSSIPPRRAITPRGIGRGCSKA